MGPVLVLCVAAFAIAAGFHVLAILGVLQVVSGASAVVLMGSVFAGFGAAILTHPKSEARGGRARLSLVRCLKPMRPVPRIAYVVMMGYTFVAAIATAPRGIDGTKAKHTDLLQAPFFFTAFALVFATCALAVSHSAVLYRKHPFGFDEP